jgi:hypothetical protein
MVEWTEQDRRNTIDRALLKRRCTPEDLAEVILHLGFDAAMATGQTIVADGGLTLWRYARIRALLHCGFTRMRAHPATRFTRIRAPTAQCFAPIRAQHGRTQGRAAWPRDRSACLAGDHARYAARQARSA